MANTTINWREMDWIKKVSSLPLHSLLLIPHPFLLIIIALLSANADDNGNTVGRFVVPVMVVAKVMAAMAKVMAVAPEVLVVAARLQQGLQRLGLWLWRRPPPPPPRPSPE